MKKYAHRVSSGPAREADEVRKIINHLVEGGGGDKGGGEEHNELERESLNDNHPSFDES